MVALTSLAHAAVQLQPLLSPPHVLTDTLGGRGRAHAVWGLLQRGDDPFGAAGDLELSPKTKALLHARVSPPTGFISAQIGSECGTTKLLLSLTDGRSVEAVIIPTVAKSEAASFSTLCVSSQVGCSRACAFCATGAMGLLRSLSSDEILQQLHAAVGTARDAGLPPIRNVVFMGMGEPADNLGAVSEALSAMVSPHGFGLFKRHVCVSTVGTSPEAIRALEPLPARLAWCVPGRATTHPTRL